MLKKIKERLVLWMPAVMLIFLCGAVLDNGLSAMPRKKKLLTKVRFYWRGRQ